MTRDELNDAYFDWMCGLVGRCHRHQKLLRYLHEVEFTYIIPMDGNRAEDGINLRYRFGYENSHSGPMIASYLDDRPCSVFEMMVALAVRCEEHFMYDPDAGNQTGRWFWSMVSNLGLIRMRDERFDEDRAETVIYEFLYRKYKRNGKGGLFTVENSTRDLRSMEIWYQMCLYLDEIL